MLAELPRFLDDLVHSPALVCTVGRDGVVSELFLEQPVRKFEFADPWVTIEFGGWHVHADLSHVVELRFAEAPGHDGSTSVFLSLNDAQGQPVLRFYFPHASHTYRTYTAEELGLHRRFRERWESA